GQYKLTPYLQEAYTTNTPNQFQKDFIALDERLVLLDQALGGKIVKIFPLLNDENNKWVSAVEYRGGQFQVSDSLYANFIKNAVPFYLMSLEKAVKTGDYSEADKLLAAFKKNQENHGSEVLPSENKIKAEVFYNKADIFNRLYMYYGLVGLLMFVLLIFQIIKGRKILSIGIGVLKSLIFIFFALHTAGLLLRWYICGHAPWSNAYESILYVSWATLRMGLLFSKKSNLTVAAAT